MKTVKIPILLFIAMFILLLGACGNGGFQGDFEWEVSPFSYIDQNGQPFHSDDLKGQVWVADFVFTNCNTVCPPMTANMANLQERLKEENLDFQMVSFSVDPEQDTPEVLTEFGNKFGADYETWHFLTGYEQDDIAELGRSSFKTLIQNDPSSDQVIHGTSFFLVDQSGNVVKKYDGLDVPYDEIVEDIKLLTKE